MLLLKSKKYKNGFTLVEIMVAVSIFMIVMVISLGSILTVFDANRKSQSMRTVMDNLNLSLESMTRTIRFGKNYHCDVTIGDKALPQNCILGSDSIAVTTPEGDIVEYDLVIDAGAENGRIMRTVNNGTPYRVTSSDIVISSLQYRVFGAQPYSAGDLLQPQVIITISGYSGTKTTKSSFSLETTVSQRMFDSQ